jgi:hypothetical protein
MKIGRTSLASWVLLAYALVKLAIKYFFPAERLSSGPYLDGALFGALFVFGLYYLNIYLTGWIRNRKESLAK